VSSKLEILEQSLVRASDVSEPSPMTQAPRATVESRPLHHRIGVIDSRFHVSTTRQMSLPLNSKLTAKHAS
jgi:hypothetical protein